MLFHYVLGLEGTTTLFLGFFIFLLRVKVAVPYQSNQLYFLVHPTTAVQQRPPYKFFPGSGESDDLPGNIINVPLTPLWREKEKSSQEQKQRHYLEQQQRYQQQRQPHGTRSQTSSTKAWHPEDLMDCEEEQQQRWPGSGRQGYREVLPCFRCFLSCR